MEATWSLVGRDDLLAAVESAFATPGLAGVVLVGDAGVGRTRLARHVEHRLRGGGDRRVEWVSALVAPASVAFGAVGHLVPDGVRPDDHPVSVISAVAQQLAAAGGRDQVVMVIDDAHRLDVQSAALVGHLALHSGAFVVATILRGHPVPDPITALGNGDIVRRLDMSPLTQAQMDRLIDDELSGPVDGITRQRLLRVANGRPAVLRELLTCGVDSGALRQRYGAWRWRGAVVGSRRIVEQIAAQLETCPAAVRTVLEVVACGEPLSLSALEDMVDRGAIEVAEHSGLLRMNRSGHRAEVRLASPLHAEAVRDRTPVTRTRRICSRLAESVAATPMRRADDARRVAAWQMEAGVVSVPAALVPAARQVMTSDPALAEWCARAACNTQSDSPEVHLLLAQILEYAGRADEAAAVLASAPRPPDDAGEWAATKATVSYWGQGRRQEAHEELDRPCPPEPGTGHDLADALRSWLLLFDGSYELALEAARSVLSSTSASDQATVWAAAGGIGAAGLLGRLDEAVRMRRQGILVADAHPVDLPWGRAQIECAACAALYYCGDVRAAEVIAEAGYRAAAVVQDPLMLGICALQRGVLATASGRAVTAQALLREAVVLLEDTDTRLVEFCLAELSLALALAGDTVQSGSRRQPASGESTEAESEGATEAEVNRAFDPWLRRADAWVQASRGATSIAAATLLAAARAASPTAEAHLLYDAARLGAAPEVCDRLDELVGVVEGPFVGALATCARAFAGSVDLGRVVVGELVAAAECLAGLGHLVLAAEAIQAAARAYRRLGLRSRARFCAERGAALLDECEPVRTPLLLFDSTVPLLTTREREIALLAAAHTSREIAAEIGVAVSTVNNHLAQVYAKLGISGRRELAVLLDIRRP